MCSAVPRGRQLGGRKGKETGAVCSKQTSTEHLLSTGATLEPKGLALASGSPDLVEEMAFFKQGSGEVGGRVPSPP